jgi:ABC-type transport system involved in resistance to organic solvents, ATPase component
MCLITSPFRCESTPGSPRLWFAIWC